MLAAIGATLIGVMCFHLVIGLIGDLCMVIATVTVRLFQILTGRYPPKTEDDPAKYIGYRSRYEFPLD